MNIKVFHFITHINGGGAERALRDLIRHQSEAVKVNLITFHTGGLKLDCETNIYLMKGNYKILKIINFVRFLYQQRKDFGNQLIIHTHLTWALYLTFIVKKFIKFRHVHTEHSVTSRRRKAWFRNLEILVYGSLDAVVYVSEAAKTSLEKWVGKGNIRRSSIIYNLFDLLNFHPKKSCDNPRIRFLSVGRLVASKGFDRTIRAFSNSTDLDYEYHIVGEGNEDKRLKELIKDYSLGHRIFIQPWTNDVLQFYHSSDVLLVPSRFESFGLVSLEAQACGMHVLAADICGLRETAVVDRLFRTIPDPDNIHSWETAIKTVSRLRRVQELSDEELITFDKFSSKTITSEYWKIYAEVVSEY